jgi:hypothetical protein
MSKPRTRENLDAILADVGADIAALLASDWTGRTLECDNKMRRLRQRRDKLWRERQRLLGADAAARDELTFKRFPDGTKASSSPNR